MAIDTDNEQFALLLLETPWMVLPVSADGIDEADQQQVVYSYPGFDWSTAALTAVTIGKPDKYYFDRRSPRLRHALFNHIEWESDVTYQANRIIAYSGTLYYSLQATNKAKQPDTEAAWWTELTPTPATHTQAWANIQSLTAIAELTAVADADLMPIWDASAGAMMAVSIATLKAYITA